jgi:hypothetical protein
VKLNSVIQLPAIVSFLVFCSIRPASAADTTEYTKGYVQSILDREFADENLRVTEVGDDSAIMLTGERCITSALQGRIEQAISLSKLASKVNWIGVTECKDAEPPDGPVVEAAVTEALPPTDLFQPPLADLREPRTTISYLNYASRKEADDHDGPNDAGSVSLGDTFPIANIARSDGSTLQFGIEAGIFSLFDLNGESNDLVNADYLGGFNLTYQDARWSVRGRFFHQSSHLGDEFLLNNPDIERLNLSYEEANFLLSYHWNWLRLYGGGGAIFRSEPDLDPFSGQFGIELRAADAIEGLDLIFAADFQAREELDYNINESYLAGVGLNKYNDRELRLMGGYYSGYSPNGQFFGDEVEFWSLGLYYDL